MGKKRLSIRVIAAVAFGSFCKHHTHWQLLIFPTSKTNSYFLQEGRKVDFISPCRANKSIFWPPGRIKIVCDMGKTFILLVWLLPSLFSDTKLHTRKIHFVFPSCTIYYQVENSWICIKCTQIGLSKIFNSVPHFAWEWGYRDWNAGKLGIFLCSMALILFLWIIEIKDSWKWSNL